jgi:hypothetical protein
MDHDTTTHWLLPHSTVGPQLRTQWYLCLLTDTCPLSTILDSQVDMCEDGTGVWLAITARESSHSHRAKQRVTEDVGQFNLHSSFKDYPANPPWFGIKKQ